MKLISRGVDPKTVVRNATCANCHSKYEFTASDSEVKYTSDQRDGSFFSFTCTVCNQLVYASAANPPRTP